VRRLERKRPKFENLRSRSAISKVTRYTGEFFAIASRISEFPANGGSDNARIIARNNARSRQTTRRSVIYRAWERARDKDPPKKRPRGARQEVKLASPEGKCSEGITCVIARRNVGIVPNDPRGHVAGNWTGTPRSGALEGGETARYFRNNVSSRACTSAPTIWGGGGGGGKLITPTVSLEIAPD